MNETKNMFICGIVRWLNKLRSQKSLVQRMVLSLDQICTCDGNDWGSTHLEHRSWLDILPLLRALWQHEAQPSVTVVHHHDLGRSGDKCKFDTGRVGDLIRSLPSDDLKIRRYIRLLGRVYINYVGGAGGAGGSVMFKGPSKAESPSAQHEQSYLTVHTEQYCFDRGGKIGLKFRQRPRVSLLELPPYLLRRICDLTIPTGRKIEIDLSKPYDRKAYLDAGLRLVYVNKQTKRERDTLWKNGVMLKLESNDSRTSFQNFRPLLRWFVGRVYPRDPVNHLGRTLRYCGDGATEPQLLRIDLRIKASKLRDARISIMDLIRITTYAAADDDHKVFIRIILVQDAAAQGSPNHASFFEMTLHNLRVVVAKVLCTLIAKKIGFLYGICPEIYIDGCGRPVEYLFIGFDNFHRFGDMRGANQTKLRGSIRPYDCRAVCFIRYLSAV